MRKLKRKDLEKLLKIQKYIDKEKNMKFDIYSACHENFEKFYLPKLSKKFQITIEPRKESWQDNEYFIEIKNLRDLLEIRKLCDNDIVVTDRYFADKLGIAIMIYDDFIE